MLAVGRARELRERARASQQVTDSEHGFPRSWRCCGPRGADVVARGGRVARVPRPHVAAHPHGALRHRLPAHVSILCLGYRAPWSSAGCSTGRLAAVTCMEAERRRVVLGREIPQELRELQDHGVARQAAGAPTHFRSPAPPTPCVLGCETVQGLPRSEVMTATLLRRCKRARPQKPAM